VLLAVLAVHLAFNAQALWRHLRAAPPRAPTAPEKGARRFALLGGLGALGLSGALGLGYLLGLRHGRTEVKLVVGGAGPDAAPDRLALVEAFHAHSSHSRAGLIRKAPGLYWGLAPPPFKPVQTPGVTVVPLPPPARSAAEGDLLSLEGLSTLLWHTAGISAESAGIALRTAPSSGALFSSEFYVAVRALPGLPAGLWHYLPQGHGLARIGPKAAPDAALLPAEALAAVIATAVWRRTGHKYGDRCLRYVFADLGHALENLCQVAAALGAGTTLSGAFDESVLARLLQVDEREEGVLAQVLLHAGPVQLRQLPPALLPAPITDDLEIGITGTLHQAASLRGAPQWAAHTVAVAPAGGDPLPLIAARRSRRRFRGSPMAASSLRTLLQAATGVPARVSAAVRVRALSLAVEGLEASVWRWNAAAAQLEPVVALGADARARMRAAALDQDVAGDAAVVFVLSIDRAHFAADPAGAARGYRHAFIEAGLVGERLYLSGQALGLGVCGVGAFFDDETAGLAGIDPAQEWVVHLVAVGTTG
jgi:SagB-type dehydrogenase family enzyme